MRRTIDSRAVLLVAGMLLAGSRAEAQTAAPKVDTTITVKAEGPELAFQPDELVLKAGTRVRLRFANAGTMAHNFVLVKSDGDLDLLAQAAVEAEKTGHVPMQYREKMFVWTALAAPAQTVEVVFVVPPAGKYTYVCLFPGHANSMTGSLRSLK